MPIFTNNNLRGVWLSAAAVVDATDANEAAILLARTLEERGLQQLVLTTDMRPFPAEDGPARIVWDGNY